VICRELAGVCLALGKFAEAVRVAERAVVLHPDNYELLGNLAVAHLLSGNVGAAQKSVRAGLELEWRDATNVYLRQVIQDVASGRRPPPKSMSELETKPQRKKFWQFWKE
jgi:Flp pilus assembly protein TadD